MGKVKAISSDKIIGGIIDLFLIICGVLVTYPIIYIISSSFSEASAVAAGNVVFLPIGFTLRGYEEVFNYQKIWIGYKNSLIYAVLGTVINIFFTVLAAYPLSRRDLKGRSTITFLITFTMIFNGGIIPNYLLLQNLNLINTIWAIVVPNAIIVTNMIICKSFFQDNLSIELLEASRIEGCSDITYLLKIVLPLSKSILAVMVMYYAVFHWNSYFEAMIYLRDETLYPLQIFLRDILVMNEVSLDMMSDIETMAETQDLRELLKYAVIVVASVPVLIMYPFAQKYFISGQMSGAVKG